MSNSSTAHPLADTPLVPTNSKQLQHATRKQLLLWIVEANKNLPSGSKELNRSGKKEKLCAALATHYHFTLEINPTIDAVVKKEKDPIDMMILQKQLDYRHTLAEEMMQSSKENPFLLSSPAGHPLIEHTSNPAYTHSLPIQADADNATFDRPAMHSPLHASSLLAPSTQGQVSEAVLLEDLMKSQLPRMPRASGIRAALLQIIEDKVKEVKAEAKATSSETGKPKSLQATLRKQLNRRAHLQEAYEIDFKCNQDHLTEFTKREEKEKVNKADDDGLISFNLFTDQLRPACRSTITAEKQKPIYACEGQFSPELWRQYWLELNDYEVFRALCIEDIEKEKKKKEYNVDGTFSEMEWNKKWKYKFWFVIWKELRKISKDL